MGNINDSWAAVAVAYEPSGGPATDAGVDDGGIDPDAGGVLDGAIPDRDASTALDGRPTALFTLDGH